MIRDTEIQTLLEDTIRRFVREQLVPREREVDETDEIPADLIGAMREIGMFGLTIPEAYGGLGLTMEEEVRIAFELGQTSPAFRSVIGTNNGIGSIGIVLDGTEAQKSHYLPKLASGELIGSFCLTEPDAGSDAASLKTSARKEDEFYVLNGTKRFITNAPEAGLYTVMARTGDPQEAKGASGISAFIVERGTPGLSIGKPDRKMGQRGAHTADVVFEDCRVPASQLIGGVEGVGFKTAMKTLDKGRIHIAAIAVGAARRMLRDAVAYAQERRQFGQPIGEFQLVQGMLADSKAELYAAECMVLDVARRRDEGRDVSVEASCAKYFATEMCGRVADRAVQVHGGAGYVAEYGIERFYRDVRLFRLYEGTSQIQQVIIARGLMRGAEI
ncbi:acyl-CoA dehydrogenase family protein [Caballeronia sp. LZ034LL]|uniref:acyl-CoA dehydrogenase family protein n=1 Tax=Caballeronia sp. LZ034LL TaxID=3038567 RepID=UPI0028600E81|nr:acyl-CoA dehydrogenase family protein [Caballeronia sp. LZ034LL]MDR5834733.1 acyl-CoA dehydrogenase family protein [Caballeronia sp. LZ034LL]